jgi:isopentenyl-diphosphate delta-isomerase
MHRAPDEFTRELAGTFVGWGLPTAEAIQMVKKAIPEMIVFASGGINDGLDIAKCIPLGATLGGMAGKFLKAAAVSSERVVHLLNLTRRQIQVTMFAAGASNLGELSKTSLQYK